MMQTCSDCHLTYQCICAHAPQINNKTEIVLLTHPNEYQRPSNTGKLLNLSLQACETYQWDRVNPPEALLQRIKQQPSLVLFPGEHAQPISTFANPQSAYPYLIIILDGTWQEAKKMMNKSPWLQALPQITLSTDALSDYSLRRNQQPGNLCTCEVAIEVLKQLEPNKDMTLLSEYFRLFLKVYDADRQHLVYSLER